MVVHSINITMKKIVIELSREAFIPGELIEGTVKLSIDKQVSARAVKLVILGHERTHIKRGSGDDSRVYRETNYILRQNIVLHGPLYDNELELAPGNYVFEFEFMMPESALPSYNGSNVDIEYDLEARVDVPWWFDIVDKRRIYVFRSRNPLKFLKDPVTFQSDNYYHQYSDKPAFWAQITKSGFLAGEVIEGTVALKNTYSSKIRKIYVSLRGVEFARASGYTESITQYNERIEISVHDMSEGIPKLFYLSAPRNCPSSYEGIYSNFRWGVEVGLDIPFGFDIKALHPVEILR
jgi:hypothetical protein